MADFGKTAVPSYRRDIDGLRAVSILLVLVYHLSTELFGHKLAMGGFVGVDVFFVISGYLITSILVRELATTGRISFRRFYIRRARRLLPALLTMMLVAYGVAWAYLLPEDLSQFSASALWSLLFASNFFWWNGLQQYGADSGLLMPLLHTWSLAVEEQYYLIAPITLILAFRFMPGRILALFVAVTVLGFALACALTATDQMLSFYLLPSRIWELSSGAALALYLARDKAPAPFLSRWPLAGIGLALILLSGLFLAFGPYHPGVATLPAVLGSLSILAGTDQTRARRFLSTAPMVHIGLLSYSLYIWHYPVFAFGRIMNTQPGWIDFSIWLVLVYVLSLASYRLVESPLRHGRSLALSGTILAAGTACVIALSTVSLATKGAPFRMQALMDVLDSVQVKRNSQDGRFCHRSHTGSHFPNLDVEESCVFGDPSQTSPLVLVGDSHAGALAHSMKALADDLSMPFVQVTFAGCSHIDGGYFGLDPNARCAERAAQFRTYLAEMHEPIVVFSARIPVMLELELFDNGEGDREVRYTPPDTARRAAEAGWRSDLVVSTLSDWAKTARGLVLVYPVPEQGFHVHRKLTELRPLPRSAEDLPDLSTSLDRFHERTASSYAALDRVTDPNVVRVYPERLFCSDDSGRCYAAKGELIYFASDNHVSDLGANMLAARIGQVLDSHGMTPP
ncbi:MULTISPECIES: acyltransferase family protein [unclassified Meridianimarinicoccus]|uniref:acyltransferase family protein n=1 Tax=unclassified Meridianimarinicoccus TaxID=2923344 RepID=UPI0018675B43|nr:acyltransferase family protein [Fluviibacterium sp. MJW13]